VFTTGEEPLPPVIDALGVSGAMSADGQRSLIPEVAGLVTTAERCYSGVTRYPDGGGLTAAERGRREQVRLPAELIELYQKELR
jgi:hypothetical protein